MYDVIGGVENRTFRVLWAMEEMGLDYTFHKSKMHSETVASLNPSGKVPILKVEGKPITDSSAIMQYLADKHDKLTYKAGTIERAQQDSLHFQIIDEIDAVLWVATRHSFTLPEERRVPEVKESLRWEFGLNIARIADKLGDQEFLMGDKMTVPDIILCHCLSWARSAKFDVPHDNLSAYGKRLRGRKAYAKAAAN
ncbi:glutathione S-transferase family protein [Rhodalgimonas zhirmunskyi]|uniref:Glutathione S-transferase family protein n=1 Tax=Rhodalgimonas zhirmunskyi TaxID=2964767 RepID=A0AAJ1UAP5_9RHOB|nr:glutathione S-transferase family protein [Rhodoalgimonas zhirmunskyi]MDQ2094423.1 glutathione S-transferase family protein [Rhodoalgimonas zhirmunskyi]